MFKLEELVRENIRSMQPYSSARSEFKGGRAILLDANENPFGEWNRYPDPNQGKLREKLSELKKIASEKVFIGNGSDEIIDLAFRIFCDPGKDKALTFSPTYGMYEVSAAINDVQLIMLSLDAQFHIDRNSLKPYLQDSSLKLIFLCSPNNPTGNLFKRVDVEYVLQNFNGIVIVDEAYIDFAEAPSWVQTITQFPNLIVMQTFSKARGLAAARVGVAYASEEIIRLFNKVKPPYNVSELNQRVALHALDSGKVFRRNLKKIKSEKVKLENELEKLEAVKKVYPSDANFLLIEVTDADKMYSELVQRKIIARNRNKLVRNCIRVTVGTPSENKQLIRAIKKMKI
jgi:histidinol-phosphate aminotransferase